MKLTMSNKDPLSAKYTITQSYITFAKRVI